MNQQSAAKAYRFFVDGKSFETTNPRITGTELRALAGIDPHLRLFVGDHGRGHPDDQIVDGASVDLAKLGEANLTLASLVAIALAYDTTLKVLFADDQ